MNDHFRPQHLIYILHVSPEKWGVVTTIQDGGLTCKLERMLGIESAKGDGEAVGCHDPEKMGKEHTTGRISEFTTITEVDEAILNAITREEYKILGPYLG